jgi:hypothetical protein
MTDWVLRQHSGTVTQCPLIQLVQPTPIHAPLTSERVSPKI